MIDSTYAGEIDDRHWIRLALPGVNTERYRLRGARPDLLAEPLTTITETTPISMVSVLTMSGRDHEEYLLSGRSQQPDRIGRQELSRAASMEVFDHLLGADVERDVAALAAELEPRLLDRIGLTVVEVDLGPVGGTPAPTNRLVATTTEPLALDELGANHGFPPTLARLAERGCPHLARTRIARTTADTYCVEQQLATLDPARGALYGDEIGKLMTTTPADGLGDAYDVSELTSSRQRLADAGWSVRTLGEGWPACHGTMPVAADGTSRGDAIATLRAMIDDEYARLCGRTHDRDRLQDAYDRLGVTPTIQVEPDALASVLGVVPNYDHGEWFPENALGRAFPHVERVATLGEAAATDMATLSSGPTNPPALPSDDDLDAIDPWMPTPRPLVRAAVRGLWEHGETRLETDVPREVTFGRPTSASASEPVVVGTKETLWPGDLILAAHRGGTASGVTVITDSRASASWVCDVYRRPFRFGGGDGVKLYQSPTRYWISEDGAVLRPAETRVVWHLDPDGTVTATHAGQRLLRTQSRTATLAGPSALPVIRPGESGYVLEEPDGERRRLSRVEAIPAYDLLPVALPVVPQRPSYLDIATVFVIEDGRLVRYTPSYPDVRGPEQWWAWPALDRFLGHYTYRTRTATLPIASLAEWFRVYLHPVTVRDLPSQSDALALVRHLAYDGPGRDVELRTDGSVMRCDRKWRYPLVPDGAVLPWSVGETLPDDIARQFAEILTNHRTYV